MIMAPSLARVGGCENATARGAIVKPGPRSVRMRPVNGERRMADIPRLNGDIRAFRDCLQYMLNRRLIAQSGSLTPAVTPMARIPPNGLEKAQWHAKQVLDLGAYG